MKVYVVTYRTESMDRGLTGVFMRKPTRDEAQRLTVERHPEECEDGEVSIYVESILEGEIEE